MESFDALVLRYLMTDTRRIAETENRLLSTSESQENLDPTVPRTAHAGVEVILANKLEGEKAGVKSSGSFKRSVSFQSRIDIAMTNMNRSRNLDSKGSIDVLDHQLSIPKLRESMRSLRTSNASLERPTFSLYPRKSVNASRDAYLIGTIPADSGPVDEKKNALENQPRPISLISLKKLNQIIEKESQVPALEIDKPEYNEYLAIQQRHSSSQYIQKINSDELIWEVKNSEIKMLGPYLMGGRIGKGAFGKVKEGICSDSLQRIAVKIIGKKRVKKMVDNVIREIKLLRRLKHKNVVTLVDVFAKVEDNEGKIGIFPWFLTIEEEPIVWIFEDGTEEEKDVKVLKWYIILEFCPCTLQTLLDHSATHSLPELDCHRYFVQLMEGMEYLHSQKVIRIF
jgi:hypothetical protein